MRYWAAGFLLTVLLFGGALLGAGKDTGTSRPVPDADPGQTGTVPGQSAADGAVLLRVWDGEQVVEMTMAEYLPGVVRGEMPASFHQQALDAQAVAERTFICYHMASGRKAEHPDADVCMDYHCTTDSPFWRRFTPPPPESPPTPETCGCPPCRICTA